MTDIITIPADTLKTAATAINKLNTLVALTKGQVAEVYVVLVGNRDTGEMYMEHFRNGMRLRYRIDGARIESDIPTVMMCVELSFFNAVKKSGDIVFTREPNATAVTFQQDTSKGRISLTPAQGFLAPQLHLPDGGVNIPVDIVRAGLAATVFSSQDPTMSGTGVLSSVSMRNQAFEVVTYDSLCGAVYTRDGDDLHADIPDGFTLTLPNQMMSAILSQADSTEMLVSIGRNELRFQTPRLDVLIPKSDYPLLPVAKSIQACIASAQHGFTVDVAELTDAVTTNATYLSVDKEAVNISLEIAAKAARVSVKSAKIAHQCVVAVDNFKGQNFQVSCDIVRLQTFLRLVKGCGRLTALYANHRIIFRVPGCLYAFVES